MPTDDRSREAGHKPGLTCPECHATGAHKMGCATGRAETKAMLRPPGPSNVTIPCTVWDSAQAELHDLRALIGKIAGKQETLRKYQPWTAGWENDFFSYVESLIAEYRDKDYRG